jgi:16S rRNA processing protein RimM
MASELFTPVGRIVKTHGLNGEVSFMAFSDASLDALCGLDVWVVPPSTEVRVARFESWRPGPKGPIVTLSGVDSIDAARTIVGRELLARTDSVPEAWEQELEDDFIGMRVNDAAHGDLGMIEDLIVTGANDVWVVSGPYGEVLIPVIDDVVLAVDHDAGSISVRLLPGLLPEEGENA